MNSNYMFGGGRPGNGYGYGLPSRFQNEPEAFAVEDPVTSRNEMTADRTGRGCTGGTQASPYVTMRTDGDSETMKPVTIKQIKQAVVDGKEPFMINNTLTKHITVVARVLKRGDETTMISLVLDDCTGVFNAVYMLPPDEDLATNGYVLQRRRAIKARVWVRIVGVLCHIDGEIKISIIRMRALEDHNEVVYHRLEAIKTYQAETNDE